MIGGAIEIVGHSLVSGWLYSPEVDLCGAMVLAFIGDHHVGAGRIEIMRRDIKAAGLGNGQCGFYFPVSLQSGEDPACIVVRLENSDLSLLQAAAVVAVLSPNTDGQPLLAHSGAPEAADFGTAHRRAARV
jgi:hypothetical protein